MKYDVTIEKTLRICIQIEAENNDAAEKMADKLLTKCRKEPEIFNDGDVEYDYALCDENGGDVVCWN